MLTSLDGYDPGDVIEDGLIDTDNLDQYFTIREIQPGDDVYQRIYGQYELLLLPRGHRRL